MCYTGLGISELLLKVLSYWNLNNLAVPLVSVLDLT